MKPALTTDELRAAYNRASYLKFLGFSFKRAIETSMIRKSLEGSAKAHRARHGTPTQTVLL